MLKWALRAIVLAYISASATLNVRTVIAERHYTQTKIWALRGNSLQAFGAIKAAYEAMPFDSRIRMQYIMTLEKLRARDKTRIEPAAADLIYRISKTASPRHQAVLVSRATYLMNSGRWKDSDEIKGIAAALKKSARLYPQTWMVLAYYYGKSGNQAEAASALVMGLKAGGSLGSFRRVAKAINMEIEQK